MYLSVTIIIILTPIYNVYPTPERNKIVGGQVQIRHIYITLRCILCIMH